MANPWAYGIESETNVKDTSCLTDIRKGASQSGLEVHGILWVIEELIVARACATCVLKHALRAWQSDDSVYLPEAEITRRLARM